MNTIMTRNRTLLALAAADLCVWWIGIHFDAVPGTHTDLMALVVLIALSVSLGVATAAMLITRLSSGVGLLLCMFLAGLLTHAIINSTESTDVHLNYYASNCGHLRLETASGTERIEAVFSDYRPGVSPEQIRLHCVSKPHIESLFRSSSASTWMAIDPSGTKWTIFGGSGIEQEVRSLTADYLRSRLAVADLRQPGWAPFNEGWFCAPGMAVGLIVGLLAGLVLKMRQRTATATMHPHTEESTQLSGSGSRYMPDLPSSAALTMVAASDIPHRGASLSTLRWQVGWATAVALGYGCAWLLIADLARTDWTMVWSSTLSSSLLVGQGSGAGAAAVTAVVARWGWLRGLVLAAAATFATGFVLDSLPAGTPTAVGTSAAGVMLGMATGLLGGLCLVMGRPLARIIREGADAVAAYASAGDRLAQVLTGAAAALTGSRRAPVKAQEWRAHLAEVQGLWPQLWCAGGFLLAAVRIRINDAIWRGLGWLLCSDRRVFALSAVAVVACSCYFSASRNQDQSVVDAVLGNADALVAVGGGTWGTAMVLRRVLGITPNDDQPPAPPPQEPNPAPTSDNARGSAEPRTPEETGTQHHNPHNRDRDG